jgi:hypothetical protein
VKKLTAFQADVLVKIARAKGQSLRPYGLQLRTCKKLESRGLVSGIFRVENTGLHVCSYQITDAGRKAAEDIIRAMESTE